MKNGVLIYLMIILFLMPVILFGCTAEPEASAAFFEELEGVMLAAKTGEWYFEVYGEEGWSDLVIKGVNIGTSLPGSWYTEFPADRELYRTWLEDIAAMQANTVRIYTLLDPAFYAVLAEYNAEPETEPIRLFQEIWPDDEVPGLNFYDERYVQEYLEEIELVIDALHGNADIPARPYRAYGNYSADVSPYLVGIMIGRELEPEEVEATNLANPELDSFNGDYVKTAGGTASPTEVWLAEMSNRVMQYSEGKYGWQYPVGFVSWPTLDPLTHLTEWEEEGKPGYNDREEVDPNIFSRGAQNKAGFFGAYHIYPNYPDFMNNEPGFAEFTDSEGVFRYRGYLHDFMAIHPPYPALVAEFGISTSLNTSHLNPEGLNHGGLTEREQGEMVVRMMRSILDEGYAGGIIFEWTDEWAKKTWNTEPFMVPWERQVLWQNAMCPEQNYGLVAVEPAMREDEELWQVWHTATEAGTVNPPEEQTDHFGKIEKIEIGADEAYLYLALTISKGENGHDTLLNNLGMTVGIDTGFRSAGEFILPLAGLPELPTGVEFMLDIASFDKADLLTVPSYNRGNLSFYPVTSRGEEGFSRIETLVNRERITADGRVFPALYSDESRLNHGNFNPQSPDYSSTGHWFPEDGGRIVIRLPWMLLNVGDPSSGKLLSDQGVYKDLPARDKLSVTDSEGFLFYAVTYRKDKSSPDMETNPQVIDFEPRTGSAFDRKATPYLWPGWEEPLYRMRLKESYDIIGNYFENID